MINIKYSGRLGNKLFMYCFARILAEELGFELNADGIDGFPNTFQKILGKKFESPEVAYLKKDLPDLEQIISDTSPRKITIRAWLQQYHYYKKYAEKIRNDWLKTPQSKNTPGTKDIVVNIRLGDYVWIKWALSPSYYIHCIEEHLKHYPEGRIHIVTDDFNSPLLEPYQKYKPMYVQGDTLEHFRFIMSATTIVLSQSTFSWWAAFLSKATKIYFPLPKKSLWGEGSHADLRVDEARYTYIENAPLLHQDAKYEDFDKDYVVVYTTLFGDDKKILPEAPQLPKILYVCFTDNERLRSITWAVKRIKPTNMSVKTLENWYKWMPHIFLSKYSKSIWVDPFSSSDEVIVREHNDKKIIESSEKTWNLTPESKREEKLIFYKEIKDAGFKIPETGKKNVEKKLYTFPVPAKIVKKKKGTLRKKRRILLDNAVGKIGLGIKKVSPALYEFLKKIK